MSEATQNRTLKLSSVKVVPKNLTTSKINVDSRGSAGKTTALSVEVIADVSLARGITTRPIALSVANAETGPMNVVCQPTMEESPDHITLNWSEKGRVAIMNLGPLLALKQIVIPEGTRMEIAVRRVNDPEYGPSVHFQLEAAPFVPKQEGKPRQKKAAPAPSPSAPVTA